MILVSANDVLPLWKEMLYKRLSELVPDAELSPEQLKILLGSSKDARHGLICKKCFNAYTRSNRDLLSLGEKMKTSIRNGLFSQFLNNSGSSSRCSEPCESSVIQIGEKRLSRQRLPPTKRFCPAASVSTGRGVTKESPPAVVRCVYYSM